MMQDNIDPQKPGEEEEPTHTHHDEAYDVEPRNEYDDSIEHHDDEASEEPEPTEHKSGIWSKIPQFGGMKEKIEPVMGRFPIKKIALIAVVVIILIIAGVFTMRSYQETKLRSQAANMVISLSSSMQDIQQYLGLPVTIGKSVTGSVDKRAQNAQLTFAANGAKGSGILTATLANGQISNLLLQTPDGQQHNVLLDEAAYKKAQAAKAAVAAKQAAIESNFNNAVNALRSKNYQAAITGFQQAVADNYQVTKSYEYLGFSYSQSNQYQQCVTFYQKYVQLNANDGEAFYQIAYCELQMYQTADALVNLDKSCKLGYAMACSAAMQIRDQLKQPQTANEYESLSPQQSIEQQQQMQQQLQTDKTQQMLNNQGGSSLQGSAPQQTLDNQNAVSSQGSASQQTLDQNAVSSQGGASQQTLDQNAVSSQGSASQQTLDQNAVSSQGGASQQTLDQNAVSSQGSASQQTQDNQSTITPQIMNNQSPAKPNSGAGQLM